MQNSRIWLTVPHARCPGGSPPQHLCDFSAPSGAQQLATALGGRALVFIGDVSRDQCDLNRRRCRLTTRFRQSLTNRLQREGPPSLLLDIHSFPDREGAYGPYEIVLLLDAGHGPSYELSRRLRTAMEQEVQNANVTEMEGATNDIQVEMHEYGVPAVLIELNEGMSSARIQQYMSVIARQV